MSDCIAHTVLCCFSVCQVPSVPPLFSGTALCACACADMRTLRPGLLLRRMAGALEGMWCPDVQSHLTLRFQVAVISQSRCCTQPSVLPGCSGLT